MFCVWVSVCVCTLCLKSERRVVFGRQVGICWNWCVVYDLCVPSVLVCVCVCVCDCDCVQSRRETNHVWKKKIAVLTDGDLLKLMVVCEWVCVCLCVKTQLWLTIPAIIDCCLFCVSWFVHFHFGGSDPESYPLQSLPTSLCCYVSFS